MSFEKRAEIPDSLIQQPEVDPVVSVQGLGKMYRLYERPQDRLKQALFRGGKRFHREFWALRDVSFEMNRGESVGIIGRNGAGKSTLLEIITGTLAPSAGEALVNGRVAALLELGSGFNPEFTGRENVFMNGAILGIPRQQMENRFDDIAAFADIGDFIDQPVKFYSSGMYIRLAFAVATSVDPDILVVDEVIAVGDIPFQHKCMRRIEKMLDRGASVLLVSHALDTTKRFCRRCLWLEQGEPRYFGKAGVAVEKYLAFLRMNEGDDLLVVEKGLDPSERLAISQDAPTGMELPPEALLPTIESLDVTQIDLFPQGEWKLRTIENHGVTARMTWDPGAVAGFRFKGSRLGLTFLHHYHSCSARIIVDGRESIVDLYRPNGSHIQTTRFSLDSGRHTVYIAKGPPRDAHSQEMWWLGGKIGQSDGRMTFKRDPELGSMANEVGRYGNGKGRLTAVELLDFESEEPVSRAAFGQRLRLRLHAERLQPVDSRVEFSFIVRDKNRIDLFGTNTLDENVRLDAGKRHFSIEFSFDVRLGQGSYSILAAFVECSEDTLEKKPMDVIDTALVFEVSFESARPVWYLFHESVQIETRVE